MWTELLQIWSEDTDKIQRQLHGAVRNNAVCQTIADELSTVVLNSASWLVQKAAVRILLAKILLLLLLIRICHHCLGHTIDKRPKQRKNAIIPVAAIIIAGSLSVICLYTSPRL